MRTWEASDVIKQETEEEQTCSENRKEDTLGWNKTCLGVGHGTELDYRLTYVNICSLCQEFPRSFCNLLLKTCSSPFFEPRLRLEVLHGGSVAAMQKIFCKNVHFSFLHATIVLE